MSPKTLLLISVKPFYCEAILRGDKRVEYRPRAPKARPLFFAVLYATRPVGAMLGTVETRDVRKGPVPDMLALSRADPLHDQYRVYLRHLAHTAALILDRPVRFVQPVSLTQGGIAGSPPQSWRYLHQSAIESIVRVGHSQT